MHFSDDDLKAALKREDPGTDFTESVMAAIGDARRLSPAKPRFPWVFRFSPIWAGALAVVLLIAGSWFGVARYQEHQATVARAKKAEQEAVLALQIANAKLHHVFQRVNQQNAPKPEFRRERL